MSDCDSVKVAVRIRPLVESERMSGCQQVVERIMGSSQVLVNGTERFTYNYVFDDCCCQEEVYMQSVFEMIDKLFKGFNATILAYGQTGSGKTYTMGTTYFGGVLDGDSGVIPRAIQSIFERVKNSKTNYEFVISCSFMELYQEQLYDLLSGKPREQTICEIREDRGEIIIPDLTKETVDTAELTANCLAKGTARRAVASTSMNQQSSRSHAIFTINIEATKIDDSNQTTISKFHLVDLAGSERSKKTNATGDRFKEGVKINQGLFALGNVISELGSGNSSGFVRYRDSKLTRLLQDSLGGNSITLMIACISPADYNVQESLSTLRYADRARRIRNKPIVNQDPRVVEINQLKSVIQDLRVQLLEAGIPICAAKTDSTSKTVAKKEALVTPLEDSFLIQTSKKNNDLSVKYREMQMQLQKTVVELTDAELRAHIAEAAYETLKEKAEELKTSIKNLIPGFDCNGDNAQMASQELTVERSRIEQLYELLGTMDKEFESKQIEMDEHKHSIGIVNEDNASDGEVLSEEANNEIQASSESYMKKQMKFKDQLHLINRELSHKEQLHQRLAVNLSKFCSLDAEDGSDTNSKLKEYENKIKELEASKEDLVNQLQNVKKGNASTKLAEERRKRLQALEQEISVIKSKLRQQTNLLKVRENDTQKIKNLNTSIQSLKESKVKLIRTMRQESESFRQWKLQREKELMQLRNKSRKMENEMARKEALHHKQRNVLKRKCEEAMAINKRLKIAIEKQGASNKAPSKTPMTSRCGDSSEWQYGNPDSLKVFDMELEFLISVFDANHTIEHLLEDRGMINERIVEIEKNSTSNGSIDETSECYDEWCQLQEELKMRNAQIAALQRKVCEINLEERIEKFIDTVKGVRDERSELIRYLIRTINNIRREYANRYIEQKTRFDEQCVLTNSAEERYQQANKRMRLIEVAYNEAIADRESAYEAKVTVLLRELQHKAPHLAIGGDTSLENLTPDQIERLKIQEEMLNKIEELRNELEECKKELKDKSEKNQKNKSKEKKTRTERADTNEDIEFVILSDEESDESENDDMMHDPEWQRTPVVRRRKLKRRNTNSLISSCACRSKCATIRCGCRSKMLRCSSKCSCGEQCRNDKEDTLLESRNSPEVTQPQTLEDGESKSNASSNDDNQPSPRPLSPKRNPKRETFLIPPDANQNNTTRDTHPDIIRRSRMTFDTPTSKKKFFQ